MKQKQLLNTPQSNKKLSFYEQSSQVLKENFRARRSDKVKKTIIKNLAFLKKYRLSRTLVKFLGVSDYCVSKHINLSSAEKPKQPREDATTTTDKSTIKNFFQRVDVSTSLQTAKRIKKDLNERRVVAKPLRDTYQDFKQQHSDVTASFSTFIRNKPKNVESTRKQPCFGCLCESCSNVDLKLRALSQVAARCRSDVKLKDKYEAVKITVCEKEKGAAFHKLNCIKRKCNSCGVDSLVRFYQPLTVAAPIATGTVVYSKWECVKKIYKGKEVTQIMPVTHTETVTEVILNLAQEMETLAEHLFVASWQ